MKKTVFILFLCAISLFICSCSKKEDTDNPAFPKTTWGMGMEEILDSYGVTKENTSFYNEEGRGGVFTIKGYELFGEKTAEIKFNFIDFEDNGNLALCKVNATYPQSTDMNHVLKKMKKAYGETVSHSTTYDLYQVFEGLGENNYTESEQLKIWGDTPIIELIPEPESDNYRELWKFFQPGLNEENWEAFSQNARMVTVLWQDNKDVKALEFNAYNLLVYNELKSQIP